MALCADYGTQVEYRAGRVMEHAIPISSGGDSERINIHKPAVIKHIHRIVDRLCKAIPLIFGRRLKIRIAKERACRIIVSFLLISTPGATNRLYTSRSGNPFFAMRV